MKIELKNTSGDIIFTYSKENNTVKATVVEAIRQGISLRGIDLSGAYLSYANLRYADLNNTNLRGADLYRADLRHANLSYVDLRHANLNGAIFAHSNPVLVPCKWKIAINTDGIVTIGCKRKSITDWDLWFKGNEVYATDRVTDEFKLIKDNYFNIRDYIFLRKD